MSVSMSVQVDKQRAGYEGQVRELQSRLEEAEATAAKNAKKTAQKLEQRIVEMEGALDAEHRRGDDVQKAARKQERRVTELLSQVLGQLGLASLPAWIENPEFHEFNKNNLRI